MTRRIPVIPPMTDAEREGALLVNPHLSAGWDAMIKRYRAEPPKMKTGNPKRRRGAQARKADGRYQR